MKAVVLLAVRPVARSVAWAPVAGGAGAALVCAAIAQWKDADPGGALFGLRAAMVVLAAGAAYAVEDRAAATLAGSPTPLATRRSLRVGVAVAVFSFVGAGALAVVPGGVPVAAAALEAFAMLAFVLAVASMAESGAAVAGPALAFGLLASFVLQQRWPRVFSLLAVPGDPAWSSSRLRWGVVLIAAVAVLAVSVRDPAVRWRRRAAGPAAWAGPVSPAGRCHEETAARSSSR